MAVSFALTPVLDIIASRFGWSQTAVRIIITLGTGFFMTLVIAWYHGERGGSASPALNARFWRC